MQRAKPNFKLNLSLNLPQTSNVPPPPSPTTTLKNEETTLRMAMSNMSRTQFAPAHATPSYAELPEAAFGTQTFAFSIAPGFDDVFTHATRPERCAAAKFAGDKIHLSVKPEAIGTAWGVIASLLFSADSPIDKWKVTDLARCTPDARVYRGAQFTLYAKPDEQTRYTAAHLKRIQTFINDVEAALTSAGIEPGERPASDVWPSHWRYASYRNEYRSGREGGSEQSARLREEPFFRLISAR